MLLKKKHKKTVTQVNRDKSPPSVWGDILYLVSKLLIVGFVLATLYFFVFGLLRYNDDGMKPALKDGDLVVYYRLDKRYSIGDLLVYSYKGKERVARVIATEGSTIDINENGLIINGSPQQEQDIYKETLLYKEGATFPMKVPAGQLSCFWNHSYTGYPWQGGNSPKATGLLMTIYEKRN